MDNVGEIYDCPKCGFRSYVQTCCFQCRALAAEARVIELEQALDRAARFCSRDHWQTQEIVRRILAGEPPLTEFELGGGR